MAINGFNINEFRSNYQDLARSYTFMLMLNNPFGVLTTDTMKYLVNASSMPGSTIEAGEIQWQGSLFPLATTHTYDDWTVTFRMDNAAQVRKDFLAWDKFIHNPETNVHASPADYMVDQEIWQLNTEGDPILKLKLIGAWPTTIGELTLDYASKEISTFDVTFKYLYNMEV